MTGQSFDDLYRALRPGLIRLAYLIVGSQPVAEELVQDAFLCLHQQFEDVDNCGGFLRVVLVRMCVRAKQRQAMETDLVVRGVDRTEPVERGIDEVWVAVQRLRPERRAVLVLRYYEDLPHHEIAALVGCPVVTVRTRVRRALADLRRELER